MSKRSNNFERREADFYPTPRAAVVPLIPYLRGICSFAEPCAGDGALVRHLEGFGLRCVYSGDIRTGQDALALDSYGTIDSIITNPPFTRELMHRLIAHFQRIAPTWLLLESDWAQTKQAAPFMASCSDIVAIGRVKWIEGLRPLRQALRAATIQFTVLLACVQAERLSQEAYRNVYRNGHGRTRRREQKTVTAVMAKVQPDPTEQLSRSTRHFRDAMEPK
jgi:hypothetical protein